MLHGKVMVAQGGGPTAVINESLAGVVVEARKVPDVQRVYGAFHGVRGIIDEELEAIWSGDKSPQEAMDSAKARGDALLRRFEQANG